MNQTDIAQLAVEIAQRIVRPLPISIVLWDSELIGQYMNRTARHVMEKKVCLPSFPKPILMPNSQPLWKASEVIAWAESYQEKAA